MKKVRDVAAPRSADRLSSTDTIILWDVFSRQRLGHLLTGHINGVGNAVVSPDGKILASRSLVDTIILRDVTSQQGLGRPPRGHSAVIWSVAFSPNGKMLASGSLDKRSPTPCPTTTAEPAAVEAP